MDEPRHGTVACPVSVGATATVTGGFHSVPDLEPALREAPRAAARQLYARAFAALQDGWLAAHRPRFTAPRGRTLQWLTPFGPVDLPVRLVREKASGRYLTLSKVFLRPKATRLLSPALEQAACAAATEQNDRPAARARCRGIGARLGADSPDPAISRGCSGPPCNAPAPAGSWNGRKPRLRPPGTPNSNATGRPGCTPRATLRACGTPGR